MIRHATLALLCAAALVAAAIAHTTAATRYTPSKLLVSLRAAGASFGTAVEPAPGSPSAIGAA